MRGDNSCPHPVQDCDFIEVKNDSEQEHQVFLIEEGTQIHSIELMQSNSGKPSSLSVQLR